MPRSPYTCAPCALRILRQLPLSPAKRGFRSSAAFRQLDSTTDARPSIAPKINLDIRSIRRDPELYSENCVRRRYKGLAEAPFQIVKLFDEWLALQQGSKSLREESRDIGEKLSGHADAGEGAGSAKERRDALLQDASVIKKKLAVVEEQEDALHSEMQKLAIQLPNLTSSNTPIGDSPKVLGYINPHLEPGPSSSDRVWKSHVHIGQELGLLDFSAAATTSGWGWYFLLNEAALLEQALVQYALGVVMKHGWQIVSPPSIVYSHIAAACGFRPRDQNGEQQIYTLAQAERENVANGKGGKPELALTGTAEIPLAGMKANKLFEEEELQEPIKVVGASRCYRAEAGSRGADTKGLYRVHEFTKVEMFGWTLPDTLRADGTKAASDSDLLFHEMVDIQVEILESLGLHSRILEQPSHDLGASAIRKQDIEAFFPSRREISEGWGELSSASNCTDYQSRRLNTRVRLRNDATRKVDNGKKARTSRIEYPHTVNGTALAVPRVIMALLENGWDKKDNSVQVPEVLRPWMYGIERIKRNHVHD